MIIILNHLNYFKKSSERVLFVNTNLGNGEFPNVERSTMIEFLRAYFSALTLLLKGECRILYMRALGELTGSLWEMCIKILLHFMYIFIVWIAVIRKVKVRVIDLTDHISINARDKFFFNISDVYYKRELARNRLNSCEHILPFGTCLGRAAKNDKFREKVEKLRSISLGFGGEISNSVNSGTKEFDFFYSGEARDIEERKNAENTLQKMKEIGYRVFLPKDTLSYRDYFEVLTKSWFCLSPIGCGWDCYRHYEIVAAGSIALLSKPSIAAYKPFGSYNSTGITIDFDIDLLSQLVNCMKITEESRYEIIDRGRKHLVNYHTHDALGEYLLEKKNH